MNQSHARLITSKAECNSPAGNQVTGRPSLNRHQAYGREFDSRSTTVSRPVSLRECENDMAIDGMCGRCYEENVPIFPANCAEHPERLVNQSIGMYHCPDCGAMVMAGMEHPYLCQLCWDRKHPAFDQVSRR